MFERHFDTHISEVTTQAISETVEFSLGCVGAKIVDIPFPYRLRKLFAGFFLLFLFLKRLTQRGCAMVCVGICMVMGLV